MVPRPMGVVALVVLTQWRRPLARCHPGNVEPNVPGENGLIVFQRLVERHSSGATRRAVFTISADGSGLHQITSGPPIAADPAWAPGKRVVMEHGKGLGCSTSGRKDPADNESLRTCSRHSHRTAG